MRRNGFKKKTYSEALNASISKKKTAIAKLSKSAPKKPQKGKKVAKKTPIKTLKNKLWKLCREITILRYGNTCYTTGQQNLSGSNLHCGHGKPKGALPLRYQYDLRNLRPQSYHANINLGGMSDIFIAKLEREKEGLEFLKESCVNVDGRWEIRRQETMGSTESYFFITSMIEEYEEIHKEMLRMR